MTSRRVRTLRQNAPCLPKPNYKTSPNPSHFLFPFSSALLTNYKTSNHQPAIINVSYCDSLNDTPNTTIMFTVKLPKHTPRDTEKYYGNLSVKLTNDDTIYVVVEKAILKSMAQRPQRENHDSNKEWIVNHLLSPLQDEVRQFEKREVLTKERLLMVV